MNHLPSLIITYSTITPGWTNFILDGEFGHVISSPATLTSSRNSNDPQQIESDMLISRYKAFPCNSFQFASASEAWIKKRKKKEN